MALLLYGALAGGCVAWRKPESWVWHQPPEVTQTGKSHIRIELLHATSFLPLPLTAWEISRSDSCIMDIDFHTSTRQYLRLDSVRYALMNGQQPLGSGVAVIRAGDMGIRSYSPDVYRVQCTTRPIAKLRRQQVLAGTFVLYVTDLQNQPQAIHIGQTSFTYHRPHLYTIL
ncbi:hypothetical protein [Hymenobacter yonginensis]|uniref:Gliding motility lipoprotein GldH n=1 Tax=Hymenobacter yonginensis TaxID=748197 RepID=A0ABY7PIB2_9BACT|nr:hypothetical protein [Hymenobacter yonginensis]WBO83087.1 hypothetical protein O9Z63_11930 [Hymenobacter yonginensis]